VQQSVSVEEGELRSCTPTRVECILYLELGVG